MENAYKSIYLAATTIHGLWFMDYDSSYSSEYQMDQNHINIIFSVEIRGAVMLVTLWWWKISDADDRILMLVTFFLYVDVFNVLNRPSKS